jgi:hypothetical protein
MVTDMFPANKYLLKPVSDINRFFYLGRRK